MERPSCGTKLASQGVEELQHFSVAENAIVWESAQGVKILGTPIGHEVFVKAQLMARRTDHDVLLERIPADPDLQATWLFFVILRVCQGQLRIAHGASRSGGRILCIT